jgi:hypothetical protein
MTARAFMTVVSVALMTAAFASAQVPASDMPGDGAPQTTEASPWQFAAGLHAYPAEIRRALLVLASQPAVLQQLSKQPDLLDHSENLQPAPPAYVLAAIRDAQRVPEAVTMLAELPDQAAELAKLYTESPNQVEARLAQWRNEYDAAMLRGTRAWQAALEKNPAAAEAYRELLTRFCRDELKDDAEFPHVQVAKPEYYYACPPSEFILAYIEAHGAPSGLDWVMKGWWEQFGPQKQDEIVLDGAPPPEDGAGPSSAVVDLPREQRLAMWHLSGGAGDESLGLVPIIMQPLADQPVDAQLAFAVAEQARFWVPDTGADTDAQPAVAATDAPEPAPAVAPPTAQPRPSPAPPAVAADDGFVPWTEAINSPQEGASDNFRYSDQPGYGQAYGDSGVGRTYGGVYGSGYYSGGYVRYSPSWYRLYYDNLTPTYAGYLSTGTVLWDGSPWSSRDNIWRAYRAGSTRCHAHRHGSHIRVTYYAGDGTTLAYDYPYWQIYSGGLYATGGGGDYYPGPVLQPLRTVPLPTERRAVSPDLSRGFRYREHPASTGTADTGRGYRYREHPAAGRADSGSGDGQNGNYRGATGNASGRPSGAGRAGGRTTTGSANQPSGASRGAVSRTPRSTSRFYPQGGSSGSPSVSPGGAARSSPGAARSSPGAARSSPGAARSSPGAAPSASPGRRRSGSAAPAQGSTGSPQSGVRRGATPAPAAGADRSPSRPAPSTGATRKAPSSPAPAPAARPAQPPVKQTPPSNPPPPPPARQPPRRR